MAWLLKPASSAGSSGTGAAGVKRNTGQIFDIMDASNINAEERDRKTRKDTHHKGGTSAGKGPQQRKTNQAENGIKQILPTKVSSEMAQRIIPLLAKQVSSNTQWQRESRAILQESYIGPRNELYKAARLQGQEYSQATRGVRGHGLGPPH